MKQLFALLLILLVASFVTMSATVAQDEVVVAEQTPTVEDLSNAPDVPLVPVSASPFDGILLQSNEAMMLAIAGVVSSIVGGVLMKRNWSDDVKAGVYLVISIGLSTLYTLTDESFDIENLGRRLLVIFFTGTIFYQLLRGPMQTWTARTDARLGRTP